MTRAAELTLLKCELIARYQREADPAKRAIFLTELEALRQAEIKAGVGNVGCGA